MLPLFVRARGAVFHEGGFCLDAPALPKNCAWYFSLLDKSDKIVRLEPVPGCNPGSDTMVNINLRPYPDTKAARAALVVMCCFLEGAMAGKKKDAVAFGHAWAHMIFNGLALKFQPRDVQVAALSNLYGSGRIFETMQRAGGLASLEAPNYAQIAAEAFA